MLVLTTTTIMRMVKSQTQTISPETRTSVRIKRIKETILTQQSDKLERKH